MRTMADSTSASDLPDGHDLYAAYIDGAWADYDAAVARFGAGRVVAVTVDPASDHGTVGDGPPDNGTWAQWVGWVGRRRQAGADPTMYTDGDQLAAGREAFAGQGAPEPHWWVANWTGAAPTSLKPGEVAEQYASPGTGSGGHYDLSVVADYWPGVDPAPAVQPPAPPAQPSPPTSGYVVTYLRTGRIRVTRGSPTIVKGPTGRTRLTASDEGLTNWTPHYTGTVGNPTAAARADADLVAMIGHLTALGQNRRASWLPSGAVQPSGATMPPPAADTATKPAEPAAAPWAPAPGLPVVRAGEAGPAVTAVQRLLNVAGHGPLATDGHFGPLTEAAVRRYQSGMSLAVDGVVGPATWAKLA